MQSKSLKMLINLKKVETAIFMNYKLQIISIFAI